jgi:hypothetical protein
MKNILVRSIIAVLVSASFIACKKDNYDPPQSLLTARLIYKGEPVNVEYNQVPFQLFQFGFGKVGPISSTVDQDGKFSALLFDGNYKLTIPANQGPFIWKKAASGAQDSLSLVMKGNQDLDIEVTPYFMIRSAKFVAASGKVTGTFSLDKIVTDVNAKNIERVNLYINKTQFVGTGDYNIASSQLTAEQITNPATVSMTVNIPAISPTQNYVFARVGLKLAGVEDMVFSQVEKIQF